MRAHLPERRLEWGPDTEPTAAERRLLDRVVELTERADARGLASVLHEDVRFTMPPQPGMWQGRDRVLQSWIDGGFGSDDFGSLRCLITRANRQPAIANYVKRPGDRAHLPMALDVLRTQDGTLIDVVTFGPEVFPPFDLPLSL
jgi:RNA polymerase sigma-70 factor (ECF subfamily)